MTQKEILTHGTVCFQDEVHRFGSDALLLARFCRIKRNEAAVDLGTGCGIIPLEWYDSGHRGTCRGVELSPDGAALLQRAIDENGADNIRAVCADLRTFAEGENHDLVCCNPPYFTAGPRSTNTLRAAARHEETCTLADVCAAGYRLLRDGGRLCVCLPPARLADAMWQMKNARLEPKRLTLVRQRAECAPWLCLLEAQKNRAVGLVMTPDIVLCDADGNNGGDAQYGK